MNDLISRQDVYEILTEYYHHHTDVQHNALREALSRVPPVEPERIAKVIDNVIHVICCEKCGRVVSIIDDYCPRCGAKLDWNGK